jgi:hypothetical protein
MSLLTMCQHAARMCGVPAPTTIVGNNDLRAVQLLACAQEEGEELAKGLIPLTGGRHYWQAIRKEATITTSNGDYDYALPSDFAFFVPDTGWDRTNNRPLYLDNPQEWQLSKSGITGNILIYRSIILRGNFILVDPTPTSSDTLAYEYISKNFCQSSGGTGQSAWAADTDTGILSEDLMRKGIKWRFKRAIGAPFDSDRSDYEMERRGTMSGDNGSAFLTRRSRSHIPLPTIPETGVGQ